MRTPRQWFQLQVANYRIQKYYADRDNYARNLNSELDKVTESMDKQGASERDKTITRTEMRLNRAYQTGERLQELDRRKDEITSTPGLPENFMRPEGNGLGGLLGKLFNGRMNAADRERGAEEFNKMRREALVTPAEMDNLGNLRAEKEMELKGKIPKQVLRDATLQSMKDIRGKQLSLAEAAKDEIKRTNPGFNLKSIDAHFTRATEACMKEGDLEYNKDVIQTFCDYSRGYKTKEVCDKTHNYLKGVVDKLNAVDNRSLDPNNFEMIKDKADALVTSNFSAHPILDICNSDGYLANRLFGSAENQFKFAEQAGYQMSVYNKSRANLFAAMPDDKNYLNYTLVTSEEKEKTDLVEHLNRAYAINSYNKDSLDDYLKASREDSRRPKRFAAAEQRINEAKNSPPPWSDPNKLASLNNSQDLSQTFRGVDAPKKQNQGKESMDFDDLAHESGVKSRENKDAKIKQALNQPPQKRNNSMMR